MAMQTRKRKDCTLLGFEDENITAAHANDIGYWTNKIGGLPDWPSALAGSSNPICQLCSLPQLLVTQVYAPLEESRYHRTLYIFCCVNSNCWNQSQSWTCCRSQVPALENAQAQTAPAPSLNLDWCDGADNWGDDDDNGNTLPSAGVTTDSDDSSSLTTSFSALNVDQCNANLARTGSAAAGRVSPTAEIEGEEGEAVTIDTPTAPQRNLFALLETTAPLPNLSATTFFIPSFMWVCEESVSWGLEKELEMLEEYVERHGELVQRPAVQSGAHALEDDEKYEKSIPLHGDAMMHNFIMTLRENPGHVLRYGRGSSPVLIAPLEAPRRCHHCQDSMLFEVQLLPTLLPKLRIAGDSETHIDFGNVVIYTCRSSCWNEGDVYREETVFVQAEIPHRAP